MFETRGDGSVRLRETEFQETGVSGVIGQRVVPDTDLKRRLVLAYDMLASFGPAWKNRFVNLYVTSREGVVLIYWPDQPWGLRAASWEVQARVTLGIETAGQVLTVDDVMALQGKAGWSDVYFDYTANDWALSAIEPIVDDGRQILSVGHDMLLKELIDRVIRTRLEGTYNLILRDDGVLLAHPNYMDGIRASNGGLPVSATNDPNLRNINRLIREQGDSSTIIDNAADHEYLAVTRLQGPNWLLVTVFPKDIIADRAFETARLILLLGAGALLLEVVILCFVLNKQVAQPLNRVLDATNRIGAGDFDIRLDDSSRDEIGRLASSFNAMSRELNSREEALNERSQKLATVNQQLQQELVERQRAEEEIRRQREALHQSEKMSALGSMLAGVAHELNNPLAVVVGRAALMEKQVANSAIRGKVVKIREAAERCARIVKTFLAIARQQSPQRKPVQINDILRAAVGVTEYGLQTSDVKVEMALNPDVPLVNADGDQLSQVFMNIIVNAQHAVQQIAPPRRLSISTHYIPPDEVVIEFSDNGPGVPEEIHARIFDPFFTSKSVGEGTGIGLSYSYGVIQSHGGHLTLDENYADGARFVIRLPVDCEQPSIMSQTEDVKHLESPKEVAILVVDDEPELAAMLAEILTLDNHRVDIAASGNEALALVARNSYRVILTDLNMADMDGREFYQHLAESHAELVSGIIFVTGDTLGLRAQ